MKIIEKFIKIDTPRTSLIFRRYDELLETIYYGVRVDDAEDYDILSSHKHKYSHSCVDDIIAANMTFSCYGTIFCFAERRRPKNRKFRGFRPLTARGKR
mgnify:CR=1 FL=1